MASGSYNLEDRRTKTFNASTRIAGTFRKLSDRVRETVNFSFHTEDRIQVEEETFNERAVDVDISSTTTGDVAIKKSFSPKEMNRDQSWELYESASMSIPLKDTNGCRPESGKSLSTKTKSAGSDKNDKGKGHTGFLGYLAKTLRTRDSAETSKSHAKIAKKKGPSSPISNSSSEDDARNERMSKRNECSNKIIEKEMFEIRQRQSSSESSPDTTPFDDVDEVTALILGDTGEGQPQDSLAEMLSDVASDKLQHNLDGMVSEEVADGDTEITWERKKVEASRELAVLRSVHVHDNSLDLSNKYTLFNSHLNIPTDEKSALNVDNEANNVDYDWASECSSDIIVQYDIQNNTGCSSGVTYTPTKQEYSLQQGESHNVLSQSTKPGDFISSHAPFTSSVDEYATISHLKIERFQWEEAINTAINVREATEESVVTYFGPVYLSPHRDGADDLQDKTTEGPEKRNVDDGFPVDAHAADLSVDTARTPSLPTTALTRVLARESQVPGDRREDTKCKDWLDTHVKSEEYHLQIAPEPKSDSGTKVLVENEKVEENRLGLVYKPELKKTQASLVEDTNSNDKVFLGRKQSRYNSSLSSSCSSSETGEHGDSAVTEELENVNSGASYQQPDSATGGKVVHIRSDCKIIEFLDPRKFLAHSAESVPNVVDLNLCNKLQVASVEDLHPETEEEEITSPTAGANLCHLRDGNVEGFPFPPTFFNAEEAKVRNEYRSVGDIRENYIQTVYVPFFEAGVNETEVDYNREQLPSDEQVLNNSPVGRGFSEWKQDLIGHKIIVSSCVSNSVSPVSSPKLLFKQMQALDLPETNVDNGRQRLQTSGSASSPRSLESKSRSNTEKNADSFQLAISFTSIPSKNKSDSSREDRKEDMKGENGVIARDVQHNLHQIDTASEATKSGDLYQCQSEPNVLRVDNHLESSAVKIGKQIKIPKSDIVNSEQAIHECSVSSCDLSTVFSSSNQTCLNGHLTKSQRDKFITVTGVAEPEKDNKYKKQITRLSAQMEVLKNDYKEEINPPLSRSSSSSSSSLETKRVDMKSTTENYLALDNSAFQSSSESEEDKVSSDSQSCDSRSKEPIKQVKTKKLSTNVEARKAINEGNGRTSILNPYSKDNIAADTAASSVVSAAESGKFKKKMKLFSWPFQWHKKKEGKSPVEAVGESRGREAPLKLLRVIPRTSDVESSDDDTISKKTQETSKEETHLSARSSFGTDKYRPVESESSILHNSFSSQKEKGFKDRTSSSSSSGIHGSNSTLDQGLAGASPSKHSSIPEQNKSRSSSSSSSSPESWSREAATHSEDEIKSKKRIKKTKNEQQKSVTLQVDTSPTINMSADVPSESKTENTKNQNEKDRKGKKNGKPGKKEEEEAKGEKCCKDREQGDKKEEDKKKIKEETKKKMNKLETTEEADEEEKKKKKAAHEDSQKTLERKAEHEEKRPKSSPKHTKNVGKESTSVHARKQDTPDRQEVTSPEHQCKQQLLHIELPGAKDKSHVTSDKKPVKPSRDKFDERKMADKSFEKISERRDNENKQQSQNQAGNNEETATDARTTQINKRTNDSVEEKKYKDTDKTENNRDRKSLPKESDSPAGKMKRGSEKSDTAKNSKSISSSSSSSEADVGEPKHEKETLSNLDTCRPVTDESAAFSQLGTQDQVHQKSKPSQAEMGFSRQDKGHAVIRVGADAAPTKPPRTPKSQRVGNFKKFIPSLRSSGKKDNEKKKEAQSRFDGQYQRGDDVTQDVTGDVTKRVKKPKRTPSEREDFQFADALEGPSRIEAPVYSQPRHFVVVAVDFGTTHSGYAFSFTRDANSVYMMRRWAGEEPGVVNQKTLTSLLLTPGGEFHSFGYSARSSYLNLVPIEARHWLYFSTFKMELHHNSDLNREATLMAFNGVRFSALKVFAYSLRFFKNHALQQLSDQSGTELLNEDIRWVITVPAIWKAPAKQFMRQAAYEAGMASASYPEQLLIALEPEAASIYCRRLRIHQLVPEQPIKRPFQSPARASAELINVDPAVTDLTVGSRYIVVDCGGGTVDITVHDMDKLGQITELHRATGGPHGSIGVDKEFERLLCGIFGLEFVEQYKRKYPMGWVHLMTDFESRKRSASPFKSTSLNVSPPFTFISDFKKHKCDPETAVKRFGDPEVEWSPQGMLRLSPVAMKKLFLPTVCQIKQAVGDVLNHPNARDLKYLFLVGGFAESPILQYEMRQEFGSLVKILIPQEVSLAILKGAVLFGIDPSIVCVRMSRLTYGVGILNRFDPKRHPTSKKVRRNGVDWCIDIFDKYVETDQPVMLGNTVVRSYSPAKAGQVSIVLNIYSSLNPNVKFITDSGVSQCGTLCLSLPALDEDVHRPTRGRPGPPREIQARMSFGDTEISVVAIDVITGRVVKASVDFLGR